MSKKITKEVITTVGNPLTAETRNLEGIRTWKADYLIDQRNSIEDRRRPTSKTVSDNNPVYHSLRR